MHVYVIYITGTNSFKAASLCQPYARRQGDRTQETETTQGGLAVVYYDDSGGKRTYGSATGRL